jgi:phosphate transport system substrate-binding protein
MHKKRSFLVLTSLLVLTLALAVVGCQQAPVPTEAPEEEPTEAPADPTAEPEPEGEMAKISVAGSTTVQPLAELFSEAFTAQNPNVEIDVQGGGSSVGVKSAGEGTADVGMASRKIKDSELEEFPNLAIHTVARDGIAVAVHPDVEVDGLTLDEARAIFAGEITNWSEVGGPDTPITVVSREEGSGTRGAFEEMVMGKEGPPIVDTALLFPSNGAVRTAVATTPDSVGYLSFGYLDESVKALAVDGVEATVANALSGEYPVVRPLNMLTDGEPSGIVKEFLDFVLSDEGQAVVVEEGYLSVLGGGEAEAEVPTGLSGSINVAGSTTVQPVAEALAEAFGAYNPDVQVDVQGGGSSVGVKSAGEGTVDIGAASREVKESELADFPNLMIHTIARDGIAIVVYPDVAVDGLTKDEVRDIFAGEIINWSEVGGPDAAITVISREEGSGTRGAFEEMVMGKEGPPIVDTALLFPSNGAVRTAVSTTPDSIAFLSFGYLDESVKALSVDGVEATVENALSGEYPVVRPLNMLTDGEPGELARAWLDFILSAEGQAVVVEEGYLSVK